MMQREKVKYEFNIDTKSVPTQTTQDKKILEAMSNTVHIKEIINNGLKDVNA